MSLPQIAQQLASQGRNGDSMLVHMTPNEVKGLHAIAAATGTQITTNPETGLPEAFSLEGFLPMLAGAVLAPFTGGLSAALLVGGGYGLATGSLEQGLMAGLGAFGGHGLATGLMNAGGAAAANTAAATNTANAANAANTAKLATPNLATSSYQGATTTLPGYTTSGAAQTITNPAYFGTPTPPPGLASLPGGLQGTTAANDLLKQQTIAKSMNPVPSPEIAAQKAAEEAAREAAQRTAVEAARDTATKTSLRDTIGNKFNDLTAKGSEGYGRMGKGLEAVTKDTDAAAEFLSSNKLAAASAVAPAVLGFGKKDDEPPPPKQHPGMIRPYEFERTQNKEAYDPAAYPKGYTGEKVYFTEGFKELPAYEAPGPEYAAKGGIMKLASGGTAEPEGKYSYAYDPKTDSYKETFTPAPPKFGTNKFSPLFGAIHKLFNPETELDRYKKPSGYRYTYDPVTQTYSQIGGPADSTIKGVGIASLPKAGEPLKPLMQPVSIAPYQSPEKRLELEQFYVNADKGLEPHRESKGMATGGISHLGGYSDGGRMLKGPGDGMSDDIPANIGGKQPARLADGEFVVPADVVSHLGNGSTDAGAKKLYKMMAAVRKARTGNSKQGKKIKPEKYLPKR